MPARPDFPATNEHPSYPGPAPGSAVDAPVAAATAAIDALLSTVSECERAPVESALGRVLAADLLSPIDVPAHDNAAMDGYAIRASDLAPDGPTRLTVAGTVFAGKPWVDGPATGRALRIMTGAVMPPGMDTVVVQEVVTLDGDQVVIPPGQAIGQNRRLRGEDLCRGRPALRAGRLLTPADLGLIASLGLPDVELRRRLRVAVLSTGDEVRQPGEPLTPGTLYDSNRFTIRAMLKRLGCEVLDLGIVRDRPESLEATLSDAASRVDAIISSGGVSVGEADFTREVMARLGQVAFWRIAMRPGRPLAFGRIGSALYFGLPGNPVAVMVTFLFFVRGALLRMMGAEAIDPPVFRVRSAEPIRKKPGRTEYQRGLLSIAADGVPEARVTGQQGSGVLRSMSEAHCMIVLGHEQGTVAAGDWIDVIPFNGLV